MLDLHMMKPACLQHVAHVPLLAVLAVRCPNLPIVHNVCLSLGQRHRLASIMVVRKHNVASLRATAGTDLLARAGAVCYFLGTQPHVGGGMVDLESRATSDVIISFSRARLWQSSASQGTY